MTAKVVPAHASTVVHLDNDGNALSDSIVERPTAGEGGARALARHPDGTPVCDPDTDEKVAARELVREAVVLLEQLSDARATAVLTRCGFEMSFETKAEKALKMVTHALSAYPCSLEWAAVLKEAGVKWTKPPLRGTRGALEARLRSWTESDKSAANSSLFSSTGIWTSPKSKWVFALIGAFLLVLSIIVLLQLLFFSFSGHFTQRTHALELANICIMVLFDAMVAMLCFATSLTLHGGNQLRARRLVLMIAALSLVFGLWCAFVAVTTLLTANEDLLAQGYSEHFVENETRNTFLFGSICVVIIPGALILLVRYPARSYYTLTTSLFVVIIEFIIYNTVYLSLGNAQQAPWLVISLVGFVCLVLVSTVTYRQRQLALRESKAIREHESLRYTMEWMRLCNDEIFAAGLRELNSGWDYVQGKASVTAKRQQQDGQFLGYNGIEALFHQADAINPLLQVKAAQWAKAAGGVYHTAGVKAEARALQKVFRSYRGDWTCLCDLVRTSIVFHSPHDLALCLHIIADDSEVEVLRTSNDKCRLRADFDAEKRSGGYRDVQLSLRLANHTEAKRLNCAVHIAEVQLHLEPIYRIKSDDGHIAYVRARNLASD